MKKITCLLIAFFVLLGVAFSIEKEMDNFTKSVKVPMVSNLETISYPQIDLLLQEKGASIAIDVVNWEKFPYCPKVNARIARSNSHLFISFTVTEKSIRAIGINNNDPVHKDSCVEFFIQIPGQNGYYNFETNCIGTLHAAHRSSINDRTGFSKDTMDRIIRYTSLKKEAFDLKESSEGFSYNVVIGIPFDVIGLDGNNLPEMIKGNFYKCGDNLSEPHYISWNPIKTERPNFHRPDYFGNIYFK